MFSISGLARLGLLSAAIWAAVALILAGQAYLVSAFRGSPQAWWPSFAYTAAIFSVWAILTPGLVACVMKAESSLRPTALRWGLYGLGLPVTVALHVGIFVLLYWNFYNDDGRIPDRWAMAERMFVRNLDTDLLFYAAIVVGAAAASRWKRRAARPAADPRGTRGGPAAQLRIRERGRIRFVPIARIELIRAAGDYSEVVAAGESHLLEQSLASLERLLPAAEFARIHRGTIVRVDQVREVRGVGRGDAIVRLANGSEVRLSRRYRKGLAALDTG
ncbi:LytTR family DNA-binding domain-containing protein [Sphingosinicella sp. CPCC 101087]|uniref:LytTR family DNA-binding domain-containing protein n=1 Tax=Sphingosinicella sp. CPCC 101087 TaxID=2497754 RepID=UPI00101DC355|nr:LytTR family DNA-binding domain-containing protein [Sphingosinicella sp. CPCC 101087]